MAKRFFRLIVIVVVIGAALGVPLLRPETARAETGTNWTGTYFNNRDLAGAPVFTRIDPAVVFNWGPNSPGPGIGVQNWSVRWESVQFLSAGTYRLMVTSDDGVRVFVNGALIINEWRDQAPSTFVRDINVAAGITAFRIEYYQGVGDASITFTYTFQQTATTSWTAQYFNNPSLAGAPVLTRQEATINNFWGLGSPDLFLIPADRFGARFSATFPFNAAVYRFIVAADDGVRLYIDDLLVIDQWRSVSSALAYSIDVPLSAGLHTIRLEYFENVEFATLRLMIELAIGSPYGSTGDYWYGEYYSNANLAGTPSLLRNDGTSGINFNWSGRSPYPGLPREYYSVRWTRRICSFPGRPTQFFIRADDGVRFYIDQTLIVNEWRPQAATDFIRFVDLTSGCHDLRLEYFQHTLDAVISLTWSPPDGQNPPQAPNTGGTTGGTGQTLVGIVINANQLNVRGSPSINGPVLETIVRGQLVTGIARNADNSWLKVRTPSGNIGWVNARFIQLNGNILSLSVEGVGGQPQSTGVQGRLTSGLRFRVGPGTTFQQFGLIEWGETVDIVGRSADGQWYQVTYRGQTGWIYAPYVQIVQGNLAGVPITG